MRVLPWILVVVVAALLGFVAGRATTDAPEIGPRSTIGGSAQTAAGDDDAQPRTSRTERPRAAADGAPPARIPQTITGSASAKPVDLSQFPRSAELFTGTVLDEAGAPVAGVLVRADVDLPRDLRSDDDEDYPEVQPTPPIEEALAEYGSIAQSDVDSWRVHLMLRREVRTDAEGRFSIGDLYDVPYDVEAWAPGFEIATEDYYASNDVRPGAVIPFIAKRLVTVNVSVVRADGRPVERAFVYSSDDPEDDPFQYEWSSARLAWTPSRSAMRVTAGKRSFRARMGDMVSPKVVETAADGASVTLRIAPVAPLVLRVVWPEDGLTSDEVNILAFPADAAQGTEQLEDEVDDDDPEADFGSVPYGRWRVEARARRGYVVTSAVIDVGTTKPPHVLTVPGWAQMDGFRVRVVDAAGALVTDADVDVSTGDDAAILFLEMHTGRHFVARTSAPSQERIVIEAKRDNLRVKATVPHAHVGEVVLRFPESSELDVALPPDLLAVLGGGPVELVPVEGDAVRTSVEPDEEGVARFTGVAAGVYEVRCWIPGREGGMRVRVPATGPVLFRPEPFRALRVLDVGEGSQGAVWGLRTGDRVTGIDGEDFRDFLHMEAVKAAATVRGDALLTVVRGSRMLRVGVDMRLIRAGGSGVTWEPALRQ